jgi:hypothetical protein
MQNDMTNDVGWMQTCYDLIGCYYGKKIGLNDI